MVTEEAIMIGHVTKQMVTRAIYEPYKGISNSQL